MKKIISSVTCLTLLLISMIPVYSLDSITKKGLVIQSSVVIDGKKMDEDQYVADFSHRYEEALVPDEVIDLINQINSETDNLNKINEINLDNYQLLTFFQDLSIINKTTNELLTKQNNVKITWEVPQLMSSLKNIKVLHYSTVRNTWELLTPQKIDFKNKTITQNFQDLSPVAIVYSYNEQVTDEKKESHQTGDQQSLYLYIIMIIISMVILGYMYEKHKK